MKKRILAIMLACFMIVSLLPMNVFAADAAIKCPGEGVHTAENCTNEVVKVVAPACNNWGYTVYSCLGCGELFADDITENKGDHVMETIKAVAPVCNPDEEKETDGVVGGEICTICGWYDVELYPVEPGTVIEAEHNYVAEEGATCLTGTTYNCACGATYTTEAGEHVWADLPIIGLDPNEDLLEDGWAIYQCTLCEAYSDKIPVLHHECAKYFMAVGYTAPTCTETGILAHQVCTICDRTYLFNEETGLFEEGDVVIEALGHDYETPISKNGCDVTFQCIRCEEVVTETRHDLQVEHEQAATCTKVGWIVYACNYCDHIEYEYTPALGHVEAEEGVVIDPATCTEDGKMGFNCEVCGTELRTEVIPALGHNYIGVVTTPATCVTKEVTTYTCEHCGDSYEVVGTTNDQHNPADMENGIVNPATCTEDGNRIYYCTWCNERVAEVIPATGHVHTVTQIYYDCADGYEGPGAIIVTWTYCYDCETTIVEEEQIVEREYLVIYDGGTYEENYEAAGHDHYYGGTVDYSEAMEELGYKDYEDIYYNSIEYVDTLREVTCTLDGLHKYKCSWCGEYMIVVEPAHGHVKSVEIEFVAGETVEFDVPVDAVVVYDNGLTINYSDSYAISTFTAGTATVTSADYAPAVEPTCTEPGATESYTCILCGELVEAESIPALEHDIDEETATPDKAPTCEEDGSLRGGYCVNCDKWYHITVDEETNEDVYTEVENGDALILEKLGHNYIVIDSWMPEYYDRARDIGFIYAHVGCTNCGDEYIINFHRHNFVLDAELSTAPTCTEMGTNVYVCSCGFFYEDPVQPLGHRDENGNVLENICANKGEKCAVCEAEITAEHVLGEWTHMDANCQNGEYEIAFCQYCAYYEVKPLDEELGDHVWSYEPIIVDGVDTGKVRKGCTICGKVEVVDADASVTYTATVGEGDLVIGSEMAVTITLSGNTADVWGFDIDVNYDNKSVEFLRHEFVGNFNGYVEAHDEYISVAANADGSAIVTEEVVVVLYFEVIDVIDGEISITHNMTTDPELTQIEATTFAAEYDVSLMMDYYEDGIIDLLDVQAVYNFIAGVEGFEYSILGDIDMDGDIDLADLEAIYLYIVG